MWKIFPNYQVGMKNIRKCFLHPAEPVKYHFRIGPRFLITPLLHFLKVSPISEATYL